jgi:membrane protein implicated in regulation of membrane protease activity
MSSWIIWIVVAAILGAAEMLTLTAALGLLSAAALITALVAAVGLPGPIQLVVFAVAAVTGLIVVRPLAMRHLQQPPAKRFGVEAIVGSEARVVKEVTGEGGRVRIRGEVWSARAYDETLVIPVGATVDVMEIEGATALVFPREGW